MSNPALSWFGSKGTIVRMGTFDEFAGYAAAFEETFLDDDWSRLRKYFTDDAVYAVEAAGFGCRLQGPDAIFAGMKKSLDGFDRRFKTRVIALTSEPEVSGDTFAVDWAVTYTLDGAPDYILAGRSRARLQNGRIVELTDTYTPEVEAGAAEWIGRYGPGFSVAYT